MYTLDTVIEELEIALIYPDNMLDNNNLRAIKDAKRIPIQHLRLYMLALKTLDILKHKVILQMLYDYCIKYNSKHINRITIVIKNKFRDINTMSRSKINNISVSTYTTLADIDSSSFTDLLNILLCIRDIFLRLCD